VGRRAALGKDGLAGVVGETRGGSVLISVRLTVIQVIGAAVEVELSASDVMVLLISMMFSKMCAITSACPTVASKRCVAVRSGKRA
jgi:hypothetical protein